MMAAMRAEREAEASIERILVELCAQIRPVAGPPPEPDDTLSDMGFDSLAYADLAVAVDERFGVRLADADLSALRTVADIAGTIQRELPVAHRIAPDLGRIQQPAKAVAGSTVRRLLRMEVLGEEHVPRTGPAVLASNHRSFWDIPVHVVGTPRPVMFMAKRELFKGPVVRWTLRRLGGFEVRREIADVRAIDTALALLERGEMVVLYPEGTRSRTGEMLPFLKGAAWLALLTGAPIIPCGLMGTERRVGGKRPFRRRVRVAFGPPIAVEREPDAMARREKSEQLTERLLAAIDDLLR